PGAYAFVHDLVRESLYRDLSTSRRTRLHLEMGVALEALEDPERLGEIAYHYGEAAALGVAENAFFYSRRAAEHASSMMAYEDAVAHYERALRVLKLVESTPPEVACEVLLRQAEAAWGTLESAEAVQRRFVRAARAARSIQSASLLARAALGRTGHGAGPG